MKFKESRPFATPEAAERKLLELANAVEADHAGGLSVEIINRQFREAGGSYEEYGAAVKAAIAHGWITLHPSGGYLMFTQEGADLFASLTQGLGRPFEEPIPLPRGRQLVTLKDAARYIQKLPKAEQQIEEWQDAVEALLLVVNQNGPTIFARI